MLNNMHLVISCTWPALLYFQITLQIRYISDGYLLEDFDACGAMFLGSVILAYLYRELYKISTMQTSQFRDPQTLLQVKRNLFVYAYNIILNTYMKLI